MFELGEGRKLGRTWLRSDRSNTRASYFGCPLPLPPGLSTLLKQANPTASIDLDDACSTKNIHPSVVKTTRDVSKRRGVARLHMTSMPGWTHLSKGDVRP